MSSQRAGGSTTSVVSGGRRKLHTTWPDGSELVEEYDAVSDRLLLRKRRARTKVGAAGEWAVEVGDLSSGRAAGGGHGFNPDTALMAESSANPAFSRHDADKAFQWRVRNVPYPEGTFDVRVDEQADVIVIRTTNKKYYKRFEVPEVRAVGRKLHPDAMAFHFKPREATLIIQYAKPLEVLKAEAQDKLERAKLSNTEKEGDVDCKQQ